MPKSKNKHFERTWEYIMSRIWNKIPPNLKSFHTLSTAKENIKNWYFNKILQLEAPDTLSLASS